MIIRLRYLYINIWFSPLTAHVLPYYYSCCNWDIEAYEGVVLAQKTWESGKSLKRSSTKTDSNDRKARRVILIFIIHSYHKSCTKVHTLKSAIVMKFSVSRAKMHTSANIS